MGKVELKLQETQSFSIVSCYITRATTRNRGVIEMKDMVLSLKVFIDL